MMFNKLISIGIPSEDYTYVVSAIELGRMQYGSNSAFIRSLVYQWAKQHDAAVRQIADAREASLPPNLRLDAPVPPYAQPMPQPEEDDDAWDDEANDARPEDEDGDLFD